MNLKYIPSSESESVDDLDSFMITVFSVRKKLSLRNINNNNHQQSQHFLKKNSREFLIFAITLCYCGTRKCPELIRSSSQIWGWVGPVWFIVFIFWRVWCRVLVGKYINPSWRSLIEMNKITFSVELLFILPHIQRTINLEHSNSRKEIGILLLPRCDRPPHPELSSLTVCSTQCRRWTSLYSPVSPGPTRQARSPPSTASPTAPTPPPGWPGSTSRGPRWRRPPQRYVPAPSLVFYRIFCKT